MTDRVRWFVGVLCVCVCSTVAFGEDDLAALQEKKKALGDRQKKLQDEERVLVREASASKKLDKARQEVTDTRAAYDKARAEDSKLNKARDAQREAEQELRDLLTEKVADSDTSKDADKKLQKLNEEFRELNFKRGLIDLELGHRASPIMREALKEKSVVKAAAAVAAAEAELMASPPKELVEARKLYNEARAKVEKVSGEVRSDKKLQEAVEDEQKAQAELREVEQKDKRRLALAEAEKELREAREEAFKDIRKARPYLEEIEDLNRKYNEKRADVRAVDGIINSYRQALREGTEKDRKVAKAQKEVESAKKDYEEAIDSWKLGKLKKAVDDALKTFDEKHAEFFEKDVNYVALTAKEDAANAKLAGIVKEADSKKEIQKALPEIRKLNEELNSLYHQKRNIRISNPKWDAIWQARGLAQGELDRAVDDNEKAAKLRAELRTAENALKNAVEEALADIDAVEGAGELRSELSEEMAELEYKKAVAEYHLYNGNSEIAREANADKKAKKLREKCDEIRNDMRNDPGRAVVKAREAADKARGETAQLWAKLNEKEKLGEAEAARREAEQKVRAAEAADPDQKKVAEARQAHQAALNEAIGDIRKATSLREDRAELDKKIEAINSEKKALTDSVNKVRRDIERGEDKDLAKARKAIEEAKKKVAEAENSEKLAALMKKHNDARTALNEETAKAVADDSKVQKVRQELGEVREQIAALDKQVKELQTAARQKDKPTAKPKADKKAGKKAKKDEE